MTSTWIHIFFIILLNNILNTSTSIDFHPTLSMTFFHDQEPYINFKLKFIGKDPFQTRLSKLNPFHTFCLKYKALSRCSTF